ncbi:MAG: GHKL domain-containing protein [Bacteroidetes bacterium]|nr:GHKL domain-containing protein [Bacteroidota bacterium]
MMVFDQPRKINLISLIVVGIFIFSLIIDINTGDPYTIFTSIGAAFFFSIPIIFNYLNKPKAALIAFFASPFLYSLMYGFLYGLEMQMEYTLLIVPIISLLFVKDKKTILFITLMTVLGFIMLKIIFSNTEPLLPLKNVVLNQTIIGSVIIMITFFCLRVFETEVEKAKAELENTLSNLKISNQELVERERDLIRINKEKQAEIEMRKEAQKTLEESEERYQMLFEYGFDGVLIFNLEKRKAEVANQKMLDLLRAPDLERLAGMDFAELIDTSLIKKKVALDSVDFYIQKTLKEGKIHFQIPILTYKKNRITIEVTAVVLPSPNDHLVLAIVKDKTEQVNSHNKILSVNQELKNFAHASSHDMKEPLRMIQSFGQLLEKRNKDRFDKESNEFLKYIIDASRRMNKLIDDLLEYSTTGVIPLQSSKINLNILVSQVIRDLHLTVKASQAEILVHELPHIMAHPTMISLLFQNILNNGMKFKKPDQASRIEITSNGNECHYHFSIKDNGIGIEEKFQHKIFETFRRLHSKTEYEGSGIGLATCKKIVKRLGGTIWVESEPDVGTTFHFTLPTKMNGIAV